MKYRKMPKSKDKISVLGFGCMRFPTIEGKIDIEPSLAMLHEAYKQGVNYFDTAWVYHGGESESFVGKFLAQIDRSTVYVATKLPCWEIKTYEDMDEYLNKQLLRLGTSYIDYYLLHALNRNTWKNMKTLGVLKWLEAKKQEGKIRYAGFSFHDSYATFSSIVKAYDWDFTQIMLNYLDTTYQAGLKGMRLAAAKGMGVISMEPLRGGKLTNKVPPEIEAIWEKTPELQHPVARALKWVWNLPECTTLLSGMSTMEQVSENVKLANKAKANILSNKELSLYQKTRTAYLRRMPVLCSECRYCMPCPAGVAIPTALGCYAEAIMFEDKERLKREYHWFVPEAARADKCTACGACLEKCPQKIAIPMWMKEIEKYFQ